MFLGVSITVVVVPCFGWREDVEFLVAFLPITIWQKWEVPELSVQFCMEDCMKLWWQLAESERNRNIVHHCVQNLHQGRLWRIRRLCCSSHRNFLRRAKAPTMPESLLWYALCSLGHPGVALCPLAYCVRLILVSKKAAVPKWCDSK